MFRLASQLVGAVKYDNQIALIPATEFITMFRMYSSGKIRNYPPTSVPPKSENNTLHPQDVVAESAEEIKAIDKAAHNIQEEDLEHDPMAMRQRQQRHQQSHHHQPTWKEAEQELREERAHAKHPPELPPPNSSPSSSK